jgi:hypothetical protein
MEIKEDLKLIFFLTYSDKLNRTYYEMAVHLRDEGLTLVPIQLDQLLHFSQGKKRVHVISVVSNIKERKSFMRSLRVIKQSILTEKITLYHFSSFSHINLRRELPARVKNYHFVALPVSYKPMARALYKFYQHALNNDSKWMGGRRAKLPFEELIGEK